MQDIKTAPRSVIGQNWYRPEALHEDVCPGVIHAWLTDVGSLTARLRAACDGAFTVHLLNLAQSSLSVDERRYCSADATTGLREVRLCCGATPWVYARTRWCGSAAGEWLEQLGAHPLGEKIDNISTHRGDIEIALLAADSGLARAAGTASCWARRSTLHLPAGAVFIYECFLNAPTAPWHCRTA